MVAGMRPDSVVVDLAAESGGSVEGARPGKEITIGGATVWGGLNVPSEMPAQASLLYATNVVNLMLLMHTDGVLAPSGGGSEPFRASGGEVAAGVAGDAECGR